MQELHEARMRCKAGRQVPYNAQQKLTSLEHAEAAVQSNTLVKSCLRVLTCTYKRRRCPRRLYHRKRPSVCRGIHAFQCKPFQPNNSFHAACVSP